MYMCILHIIHLYIHIYVRIYIYICIYICIHMYTDILLPASANKRRVRVAWIGAPCGGEVLHVRINMSRTSRFL